jgi:hypothetical protein
MNIRSANTFTAIYITISENKQQQKTAAAAKSCNKKRA